jgi:hypothetical protein
LLQPCVGKLLIKGEHTVPIELNREERAQAVRQVQERLQERAPELVIEFNEDGFQYWRRRHV